MTGLSPLFRRVLIAVCVGVYLLFVVGNVAYSYLLMERDVNMAVGPATSYSNAVGQKLNTYLIKNEVESTLTIQENSLIMVEEVNAFGGFLGDPSDLNVGFLARSVDADQYPDVVSLGSIASLPLLIFARSELGEDLRLEDLAGKKVSIGAPGSDVNHLMIQINDVYGFTSKMDLRSDPTDVGIEQVLSGEVDAVALLDSLRSPIVADLAVNPELSIISIDRASALAFEIGYAQPATIPAYFIDLAKRIPGAPVATVALELTVIANKYLDEPNILLIAEQLSVLDPRMRIPSDKSAYPNFDGSQFSISDMARDYYTDGIPTLYKIFPDALIAWLWIPLARVLTVTFLIWAALQFVIPLIFSLVSRSAISELGLDRLERRLSEGKPLTRRQIHYLERVVAKIKEQSVDEDQVTMERALSLLGRADSLTP